jgi:hypothetical protein
MHKPIIIIIIIGVISKSEKENENEKRGTQNKTKNDQIKSRMMNDEAPIHITEALVIAAIDENIH